MEAEFLELLLAEAPAEAFEGPVAAARERGATPEQIEALQHTAVLALQLRATLQERRRRELELSALYETAGDLSSIRDVERVLGAIVRRARRLLAADTAYLTLIDEEAGDTYMRVTEGMVGEDFRRVRLPLGVGLGGLVAQLARPSFTANYLEDPRFDHTDRIDAAVANERIVAIVGVPLVVSDRVIGVLFAADRNERHFSPEEVNLLSSLAAHAAIVIENARLFQEAQEAVAELNEANILSEAHGAAVERAAAAHERLADVVLQGGGMEDLAAALAEVLDGGVVVVDAHGNRLASAGDGEPVAAHDPAGLDQLADQARDAGRAVHGDLGGAELWVTPIAAGSDHLGSLLLSGTNDLDGPDRRTFERASQVAALLLLNERAAAESDQRVRGEFFEDLIRSAGRDPVPVLRRGRLMGLDLQSDHVVVVASGPDRRALLHAGSALTADEGGLAAEVAGAVAVLVPGASPRRAIEAMRRRLPSGAVVTIGAAGPGSDPERVAGCYRSADRVRRALVGLGREGQDSTEDELGVYALLFSEAGRAELSTFVDHLLGPVLAYDRDKGTDLRGTLAAYFAEQGNVSRAAGRLHVHPNTVYQRMDRIAGLIGRDWREPDAALELHLALRVHELRTVV